MRILYLHQYFNTPAMPGGTRSFEIARRLVRDGHEVDMITSWRRGDGRSGWFTTVEDGIRVHWLPVPYGNAMSFWQRLRAFIRFAFRSGIKASQIPADIVLATSTPLTIALPGMFAASRQRIPFVFEVRDMWPNVPIALGAIRNPAIIGLARWLERRAYRRASHIIALAPGMRDDIVATGIPEEKITVVPNGCNPVALDNDLGQPTRKANDWLGKRKLVLYAGAIGAANGVPWLVELAKRVVAKDQEVRFVIFGDGRERVIVERLAKEFGLLGQSLFLFPAVPKEQLVPWLAAADLHIALMTGPDVYLKDAVNNKFFDAIAAGKPIANNFQGWQTRIAGDADIGVYLDPSDMNAAAITLLDALGNEAWLAGVPQRARLLAQGRFSFDRLASKVERVLVEASKVAANAH